MVNKTEEELIAFSLNLYANWIETGDVLMSAQDAEAADLHFNALSTDQMELIVRLRSIAKGMKG